ncbi:MAG: FAD-dependent oxidoreductase [Alphaproteobacteria bacterium]|nr:FAD-dependent oxidoreductase [Alphaproteobacteria bacterium]
MMSLPSEVDVAVIGAGAAGIAAARALTESGRMSVLVLEARERAGGRAWTVEADGIPMDLGCEWLHSADRNVLVPLAKEFGFEINERRPDWTTRLRFSGESEEAEADWLAEHEAFYWAIHRLAQEPEDRPCSAALPPGGRWNALFEAVSTWANAAELELVSAKDHDRYEDSGINWRLYRGYGRLFEALAERLPIVFGAKAARVDHHGKMLAIETSRGTVRAARVIVAVPSAMIAEGGLVFDPPLPEKLAAAAGLPLGLADKLFFHFEGGEDMPERYLVGSTRRRETMSYQVRPMGRPRINCFFGGQFAERLERDGFAAMTAFATDELAGLLGGDVRRKLRPLRASFWRQDEFARGSYSYALPGHADDRAKLALPVDNRLFFAGEACSLNFFSTAHGAYETGLAAAAAALATLSD